EWLYLATDANPNDDPTLVDTVITLYDGAGTEQLAESDDQTPRLNTDSELFYRVPTTGSYCLRVREYNAWSGGVPQGSPLFTYDVVTTSLDFVTQALLNEDSDPTPTNDTQNTAQALTSSTSQGILNAVVAGLLAPGTDVDFYSFTPPTSAIWGNIDLMPSGPLGHGSTQGPGLIRIRTSNGQVVAELDYQLGSNRMAFPVVANTAYFIEVDRPNTTVLGNDFYLQKLRTEQTFNQAEVENNGTAGQANVAAPNPNGSTTSYFVSGAIPAADVDYWSFSATAGSQVTIACSAARAGSGLINFTVALRNPGDTMDLHNQVESATADLVSPAIAIPTTGTHYLRFSATGQQVGVVGNYYFCGVHVM
ncbi:MAG: hypothetical protein KC731_13120, partial [Myxococcales bacterium]|nr:hypothetical protein [Myxococcales bacterium]